MSKLETSNMIEKPKWNSFSITITCWKLWNDCFDIRWQTEHTFEKSFKLCLNKFMTQLNRTKFYIIITFNFSTSKSLGLHLFRRQNHTTVTDCRWALPHNLLASERNNLMPSTKQSTYRIRETTKQRLTEQETNDEWSLYKRASCFMLESSLDCFFVFLCFLN